MASMRAAILVAFPLAFSLVTCLAQLPSDVKALYDGHRWNELAHRIETTNADPFYRGVVGVTFNQDWKRSEALLLSAVDAKPSSDEAYQAYEWLSHLYLYRGQYQKVFSIMQRRWAAFPKKKELSQERATINGLRGLPNQRLQSSSPATIAHDPGSIFISLTIDGKPATYFFDTGAWISCMSESEAKRLKLVIKTGSGTLGQAAGSQVHFRTAVALDVVIGKTHFKNVSFAVFPDDQDPWSSLPSGRRGIIGIPMLVDLQTLRWEEAGSLQIARQPQPFNSQRANLTFDNDHLVATAIVQNRKVSATVDTGATSTDLYKPFADKFGDLLKQHGKKDATEVRGIGHAETFDSVILPELRIQLGGSDTVLTPAHVLLKSIGASCCIGNFGMDLFKQAHAFQFDFNAMTLQLGAATARDDGHRTTDR